MSTHNICIRREIRKKLCGYPPLSVAMNIRLEFQNLNRKLIVLYSTQPHKRPFHTEIKFLPLFKIHIICHRKGAYVCKE